MLTTTMNGFKWRKTFGSSGYNYTFNYKSVNKETTRCVPKKLDPLLVNIYITQTHFEIVIIKNN